jgi:hypothetical protein
MNVDKAPAKSLVPWTNGSGDTGRIWVEHSSIFSW